MSPGSNTESYPAFAHIEGKPRKNLNQIYDVSIICQPDRSRLVPVAWQQWSEMEALIPSPAACCESLMLVGNEFQSLGRTIVKEDEYEEVRWDGIVSIVS
ncbi:hypothetical protein ANN_24349 [Periplaneta americana]|uniref:Uncharacterized protein n=1 Tax=Periplaneta americana TaxID=6978 RepID=A0ABQ8S3B3_PERAM|nr:hypothetical protein ANN_24349 [Periplaneta americana]